VEAVLVEIAEAEPTVDQVLLLFVILDRKLLMVALFLVLAGLRTIRLIHQERLLHE